MHDCKRDRNLKALTTRVVAVCARHPWLVLLIAVVLTGGAFLYTAKHIAIDSDSARLIAADVSWRQRERAFDAAFPQRVNLIAVVVDGATPELAEQAAAALTQRLSTQTGLFRGVWRPDGGPFFARAGLLFESTPALAQTMQRLITAQPLLGSLATDPSLRGLMHALDLVLEGVQQDPAQADELAQPLSQLAAAVDSVLAGQAPAFSWHSLFSAKPPDARELRRFVLVQPILDFSALQPGERASAAIRGAAHELGLDADPRLRIRQTGPVP